ncbi:FadR/GntR family transcriptional regulator [Paenibacillus solisilvae]|uniref:FadR/GntR family transcriptional regulator n=1 Tax=Paenibacillus solisilvae TaxID=2486751 RepID=A0ABW0VXB7_9BACL
MLEPINKNYRMFEQIITRIHNYIVTNHLQPGDKLMTEREMAELLQVSRSSVREALRVLEMIDCIQSKPGEGTILKSPDLSKMITRFLPFFSITPVAAVEFLETRRILEGGIAKLAAQRRTRKDLNLMKQSLDLMNTTSELEVQTQADLNFHFYMANAAKNKTLSDFLFVVSDNLRQNLYTNRLRFYSIPGVYKELSEQHMSIYQAIKDQDPERAQRELESKLDYTIDVLKKVTESGRWL